MGVGLFGTEVILDSPTGKPLASFQFQWRFETVVRDVDVDEFDGPGNTQSWDWSSLSRQTGPLLPEARVATAHVSRDRGTVVAGDLEDLWYQVRQALKARFPEVHLDWGKR